MKTWVKLSVVVAVCAFVVCSLLGNRASATDSPMLAQQSQAGPSRAPSKQPPPAPQPRGKQSPQLPPPSKHLPPPIPPQYGHPPVAPEPTDKPHPPTRVPVVAPPGMKICLFKNSAGQWTAVIVPEKSICTTDANGVLTVIFPHGNTMTVPADATEDFFYTSDHDPVIIVPYYNSTVTLVPEDGYYITLPDETEYMLPIPGKMHPLLWLFAPTFFPPPQYTFQAPTLPTLPPELTWSRAVYTWHIFGMPPFDYVVYIIGMPGISTAQDGDHVWILFPGFTSPTLLMPLTPGAYTFHQWVDIPAPGHDVVWRCAVVLPGSTVTSLGNGWYHVDPPPNSGGQAFDFQCP